MHCLLTNQNTGIAIYHFNKRIYMGRTVVLKYQRIWDRKHLTSPRFSRLSVFMFQVRFLGRFIATKVVFSSGLFGYIEGKANE